MTNMVSEIESFLKREKTSWTIFFASIGLTLNILALVSLLRAPKKYRWIIDMTFVNVLLSIMPILKMCNHQDSKLFDMMLFILLETLNLLNCLICFALVVDNFHKFTDDAGISYWGMFKMEVSIFLAYILINLPYLAIYLCEQLSNRVLIFMSIYYFFKCFIFIIMPIILTFVFWNVLINRTRLLSTEELKTRKEQLAAFNIINIIILIFWITHAPIIVINEYFIPKCLLEKACMHISGLEFANISQCLYLVLYPFLVAQYSRLTTKHRRNRQGNEGPDNQDVVVLEVFGNGRIVGEEVLRF